MVNLVGVNGASPSQRRTLYPEIEPYRTGRLRVSRIHELYYEESGNPAGKPVVFVHGGPGSGTEPSQRRFFDPSRYRIILFDQRGSGRSTPHACLEENTTWHLVADLEALREHVGVQRWQVFGGSWGSTLSLAYAQAFPERVTELLLRGIFLLRQQEIDWFYQRGASALFPDAWEEYLRPIPEEEQGNLVAAYYKRLTGADEGVRREAALCWSRWEGRTSKLFEDPQLLHRVSGEAMSLSLARIECHYFFHHGFLERDSQLVDALPRVQHIPAVIVQGRYDVVCPMESAWLLHRLWPEADLRVVPDAGHSVMEAGTVHELVSATDQFSR